MRQRRLLTPHQDILSRAYSTVEHPDITRLHTTLVLQGAFKDAEKHLRTLSSAGLFSTFLQSSHPYAAWNSITGTDRDGDMPSPRSGHAMCFDPTNGIVYVHGGYNGNKCLDDFWVYSIREDEWQKIGDSTCNQSGPGPRSCHKMVFDTKTENIYVLGRLTDVDAGRACVNRGIPADTVPSNPQRLAQVHSSLPPSPLHPSQAASMFCSEFYMYHTQGPKWGTWTRISSDTSVSHDLVQVQSSIFSPWSRVMEARRWFLIIKWSLIARDKFFTSMVAGLLTVIGIPTSMPDFMHTISKRDGGSCSSEFRPLLLINCTHEKLGRQIMYCIRYHNVTAIQ